MSLMGTWWKITINGEVFCQEAGSPDAALFGAARRCDFGGDKGPLFDTWDKGTVTYEKLIRPRGISKKRFREYVEKINRK